MKIYVINLDRRTDRMAVFDQQMSTFGLEYTRISAIDGMSENAQRLPVSDTVTVTEYACYLSHKKAWETFVNSGEEHCLIFEDDVVFSSSILHILDDPKFIDPKSDIIRLETWPHPTWLSRFVRHENHGIQLRNVHRSSLGSAAYIISKKFALRLISKIDVLPRPIDIFMLRYDWGDDISPKISQLDPAPCMQRGYFNSHHDLHFEDSDIHQSRLDKNDVEVDEVMPLTRNKIKFWDKEAKLIPKFYYTFFLTREYRPVPFDTRL